MGPHERTEARTPHPAAGGGLNKYLSISLGDNRYGIDVLRIREIIEYAVITPVPMMPSFVRGSINLRGKGVPVLDLMRRFGGTQSEVMRRSCIVIVEVQHGQGMVGLLVDAVNEVVDLPQSEVEPAPSFDGRIQTAFFSGMAKLNGEFLILLDVDNILAVDAFHPLNQTVDAA